LAGFGINVNTIGLSSPTTPVNQYRRFRFGFYFNLSASYPAGTDFNLEILFNNFYNTYGAWAPSLYLSPADDTGLYSTTSAKSVWDWEDVSGKTYIGDFTYNDVTQTNHVNIPYAALSPRFGAKACFVLGVSVDFTNSGPTFHTNSLDGVSIQSPTYMIMTARS
jgi:hypothetical protein